MPKRKQLHKDDSYSSQEALWQRLKRSLANIRDDEGKLDTFIRFCEKAKKSKQDLPKWATESSSFFSTLSITPKEWDTQFDFPEIKMADISEAFLLPDSWEKFSTLKNLLETSLPIQIQIRTVAELLCSTSKLFKLSRQNVGELVVTSGINDLLDVLCMTFTDVSLNGDKQSQVSLSDDLPMINLRNDGFLSTTSSRFFLREDKAIQVDKEVKWNDSGTDCHKLIICMKSLLSLRENMQNYSLKQDEMQKYSKVMGLSYLQQIAYLFILEATISEEEINGKTVLVPNYSIYMKKYKISELTMLELWLDIAFFIQNFVPKNTTTTTRPYRPTSETPLKNIIELRQLITKTGEKQNATSKKMKRNKMVLEEIENHSEVCVVRTASIMKTVGEEERDIIIQLMNRSEYCLYLPQILNIYSKEIEFEILQPITESHFDDTYLLELACDISVALNYLHSNNIVHRDVKPHNIMLRSLNFPSNVSWFVLIDFGISFQMEKDDSGKCYSIVKGQKKLVQENLGTGFFKAPEVEKQEPYGEKIDIYSLGASLLYLKNKTVCTTLFQNAADDGNQIDLQKLMKNQEWDIKELGEKVLQMVDTNPNNRPTAKELELFFTELCDKK